MPLFIHVCCKYFFLLIPQWFQMPIWLQTYIVFFFQVFNSKSQQHKEWICDFKIPFVNWKRKVYRTYSLRTSCHLVTGIFFLYIILNNQKYPGILAFENVNQNVTPIGSSCLAYINISIYLQHLENLRKADNCNCVTGNCKVPDLQK